MKNVMDIKLRSYDLKERRTANFRHRLSQRSNYDAMMLFQEDDEGAYFDEDGDDDDLGEEEDDVPPHTEL